MRASLFKLFALGAGAIAACASLVTSSAWAYSSGTVSAGYSFTCALRSDSTLACWGSNGFGQASAPSLALTRVVTGDLHTCGLRLDGGVECWGNGDFGQASAPAARFKQLDAGGVHTCGVRSDGALECWGSSTYGKSTPPAGAFTEVSAGSAHSVALDSLGREWIWGWVARQPLELDPARCEHEPRRHHASARHPSRQPHGAQLSR